MRTQHLIILSSWPCLVRSFNFKDFTNPISPVFDIALSAENNAGFEAQREPENSFREWDQSPADDSLFVSSLDGYTDLWEGSEDDDRNILERQTRSCQPGSFMCPDGKCCSIGKTCVTKGCCPAAHIACGTNGCYNPSAGESCCGPSGKYCPRGFDCTSSGCCPKGEKPCGNSKCYNPATQSCCPANSGLCSRQSGMGLCTLDTVCGKDQTCVDGNYCCPKGQKRCGTKGCYDPKTSICCGNADGSTCQKGWDCMKDEAYCCPAGMIKCGEKNCYDPKVSVCCLNADKSKNWGCKGGYQCCVAGEGCFDPKTQRCCADPNGPCDLDTACCGGKCCPKGYKCNKNNKCYKPPTRTTTTTRTHTCTTPIPTRSAPTPMVTVPFVYDPKRRLYPSADPSSNEVFEISNRAVLMNMCEGMKQLNGGKPTQEFKLTYAGPGRKNCWRKYNRDVMCDGVCADAVKEYVDQFFPDGVPSWAQAAITATGDMQCDEFPFANSLQGGDIANGRAVCIPADDNGFQGQTLSPFFSRKDIIAGEDYMIEIVGWNCDTHEPMRRRDVDHAAVDVSEDLQSLIWRRALVKRDAFDEAIERYGEEMYHGFDSSNSALNLMTMPLGDLAAGTYIVDLNVTKGNLTYNVVDYVGDSIEASLLSNGSVKFTLADDWEAVTLTGTTEEEDVELWYKAEALVVTEPTETIQPPVSSATDNAGSAVQPRGAFVVACVIAVVWG